MEERRFDDLSRALGNGVSRRTVLKGLVASLVGGLLGGAVVREGAQAASPTCDQAARGTCIAQVERNYRRALFFCIFDGSAGGACRSLARQARTAGYDLCNQTYCHCPEGTTQCGDAARGTCCDAGSTCHYTFPWFPRYSPSRCIKSCDPPCNSCETCIDGTCIPLYCPPLTACCNGACRFACPAGQTRNPETCVCEDDGHGGHGGDCSACLTGTPGNCVPDSSQDGMNCGSCGKCAGGTCITNPNRSCQTCYECIEGNCMESANNTACGSNEVCCDGTCIAGTTCGPCSPNWHQCPVDTNSQQICCPDGQDCCTDATTGVGRCGPVGGGCDPCPSGQHQCPAPSAGGAQICCSDGLECCEDNNQCGPVNPNGECCGTGFETCGSVCCAVGNCQTAHNGQQYCCDPGAGGVTNDGVCCPSGSDSCVNTCCDTTANETCMPTDVGICCQQGQVHCVTMCCADGEDCFDDNATGGTACCSDSSTGYANGRCCTSSEEPVKCSDDSWQCCALATTCC